MFNKNRSCIEICIEYSKAVCCWGLIKTEVVLKLMSYSILSEIASSLIKTEVVLKSDFMESKLSGFYSLIKTEVVLKLMMVQNI